MRGSLGYPHVVQPRWLTLDVRNNERIVILVNILCNVYIDSDWVAAEYLRHCKMGAWKKENTINSMKW